MIGYTRSSEPVLIDSGKARLAGVLEFPAHPCGVVLFAHGRDSSRLSARSNYLAGEMRRAGLATLLLDLFGLQEHERGELGADIALLGARLASTADWLAAEPETRALPLGLFGAGAETAAALRLAAGRPAQVAAVVSRGGRPDLAGADALRRVRAPTLLIVGEQDTAAIASNRMALDLLDAEKDLAVIRGATRLCDEPNPLREVARLSARWFKGYLGTQAPPRGQIAAPAPKLKPRA